MKEPREVDLVCEVCEKTTRHLVSSRTERDATNGLPYILGHQRCLVCDDEHPTVEELARYAFSCGAPGVCKTSIVEKPTM